MLLSQDTETSLRLTPSVVLGLDMCAASDITFGGRSINFIFKTWMSFQYILSRSGWVIGLSRNSQKQCRFPTPCLFCKTFYNSSAPAFSPISSLNHTERQVLYWPAQLRNFSPTQSLQTRLWNTPKHTPCPAHTRRNPWSVIGALKNMRKPSKRGKVTVCTSVGHIKCTLQQKGWTNLPAALSSSRAEGFGPNAVAGNAEIGDSELNK